LAAETATRPGLVDVPAFDAAVLDGVSVLFALSAGKRPGLADG